MSREIVIKNNILPNEPYIDTNKVCGMLKNPQTSYKFYLFLAIVYRCNENNTQFIYRLDDIYMDMLYYAYYPSAICNLYLGYKDILKEVDDEIHNNYQEIIENGNINKDIFLQRLRDIDKYNYCLNKIKRPLGENPIFRLLTSFTGELKGINKYERINNFEGDIPYRFSEDHQSIILDDNYVFYFYKHNVILSEYIKYELVKFLQDKNPNNPGILNKIESPLPERESLSKQRELYKYIFANYSNENIDINIYNGQHIRDEILNNQFELDHFIPFSFSANNELWNLTPTTRIINSVSNKGNKIPSMNYLSILGRQQYNICCIIREQNDVYNRIFSNNVNSNSFINDLDMIEYYRNRDIRLAEQVYIDRFNTLIRNLYNTARTLHYVREDDWEYRN